MSVRKYTGSVRRLRVVVAATALAVLVSGLYVPSAQASYGQQVRNMTAVAGAVTANDMAQQILGGATTVSNASFSGDQRQGGTVSGFDGIGFPTATILSTGLVSMERGLGYNSQPNCGYCPWLSGSAVAGPNWQKDTTYQFGTSGDSDLQGLIAYMSPYIERSRTLDVATLQFDFVAKSGTVKFPYIFASERYRANWQDTGWIYPDKWNAAFYSAMGIWVNGVQCATVGPSNEPVTVNTVNHLRNTDYYRDNPVVTPYGESRYPTGFNGMTTVLTCTAPVASGQLNHVKITVGDVGYSNYDSGVFLGTASFVQDAPDPSKSTLVLDKRSAEVGSPITATATILRSGGNPVEGVNVSFAKTNPSVSLSASSCVTGLSGQCNVTINSDTAVSDQLWATLTLPTGVAQITGSPASFGFIDPVDAYDEMVAEIGPEQTANNFDLMDFRGWVNDLPGLDTSGFIEAEVDIADRSMTLTWNGPVDLMDQIMNEGKARNIKVTAIDVPYSAAALDEAGDALMGRGFSTPQGIWQVLSVAAPTIDNPTITLSGHLMNSEETPTTETLEAIRLAAKGIASCDNAPDITVSTSAAGPTMLESRSADKEPFAAGGWMNSLTGPGCSTGFAIKIDGVPHTTTARHCTSEPYYSAGSFGYYGLTVAVSNTGQARVLEGRGDGLMFDGAWNRNNYTKKVKGWTNVNVGNVVCTSGAMSGVHCNLKVTNMSFKSNDGFGAQKLIEAHQTKSGEIAAAGGDSGGPVFIPRPGTRDEVWAVGMIQAGDFGSGKDGKVTCPSTRASTNCSRTVYFSSMGSILKGLPVNAKGLRDSELVIG